MSVRIIFTQKPIMTQKEKTCMIAKSHTLRTEMMMGEVDQVSVSQGNEMDDVERFKRDHQVPDGVMPEVTETPWDTIYKFIWWEASA